MDAETPPPNPLKNPPQDQRQDSHPDLQQDSPHDRHQAAQTIGELHLWDATFDAQTRTADIEQHFLADHALPACIVAHCGSLMGLLSRHGLLAELSKPMRRDIYIKRPVGQLAPAMEMRPLRLPGETPVAAAVEAALSRAERQYEPILVETPAGLRILEVDLLMRVQSRLLEDALIQKDALIDEVQRTANELRDTLGDLRQARDRLVQSEKMAALGQLVAGVAHEINTPIGVALTAATHLGERTGEFRHAFAENRMKRSDLQSYVDLAVESAELLRYNIQRAAQLIQSFKQVAVDQTSEQARSFDLQEFMEQLLASLSPEARKSGQTLTLQCDSGIQMDTFPGPLAQVLSNLVGNALAHAYERGSGGVIALAARQEGEGAVLTVSDFGAGIPPDILPKIYDPFFTTKRGAGGTGLGLNIVFNIVTDTLKGHIDCQSRVGEGACFTVRMPRRTPR